MHSATRYFSKINIESGFVRGNYYRNQDTYNSKFISSCSKLTPTPLMVRTTTRSPEEVDGAKEGPVAVAVEITVTVGETI